MNELKFYQMKGEVEVNGRIIHYSREPIGGGSRVGGGSVGATKRPNKTERPTTNQGNRAKSRVHREQY